LNFNGNQRLSEISVRSQEIKEIKESYQIHAICVVYTKLFIWKLSYLGLIMKKKKKIVWFQYFIRNQWFKDISRRCKEIKDIKESYQIPAICVLKMR
jgi:hypothetical protein